MRKVLYTYLFVIIFTVGCNNDNGSSPPAKGISDNTTTELDSKANFDNSNIIFNSVSYTGGQQLESVKLRFAQASIETPGPDCGGLSIDFKEFATTEFRDKNRIFSIFCIKRELNTVQKLVTNAVYPTYPPAGHQYINTGIQPSTGFREDSASGDVVVLDINNDTVTIQLINVGTSLGVIKGIATVKFR